MKSVNDLLVEGLVATQIKVWNDAVDAKNELVYWDKELKTVYAVTPIERINHG